MTNDANILSSSCTFTLADVNPGPSVGDAAEHLERLGFDPWSFTTLEIVDEVMAGRLIVATFAVTGPAVTLDRLRVAHRKFLETSRADVEPPSS